MADSLFRIDASIIAPCPVNALGGNAFPRARQCLRFQFGAQGIPLIRCELKKEVLRKSETISRNSFIENFCRYFINLC